MDMSAMSTEDAPPNGNEMYSQILVGLICAFVFLLVVRHHILLRPLRSTQLSDTRYKRNKLIAWLDSLRTPPPSVYSILRRYRSADRYVVNKFSWSLPFLPPIGALLVCIVLITAILPLLLMNTDLSLNSNRAGFLTVALVPFLLASTGKHSALALLTGMSSVRLNLLHRILGLLIVLLATVHMACMVAAWSPFPTFMASQLTVPKVRYGLAGYGCLCVVVLGSLYPVRVFKYEIFLCTHLLAFGFLGAIAKHTPYAMRYFFTGIVCYLLNLLASWFVQARLARVRAHVLPHGCTKLTIRVSSPMKHHPGQYVYLCIPRLSPFQWHPFTITSTQPTGEGFCDTALEVHATVRGDYTRKLYNLSAKTDEDEDWVAYVSGPCGRALPVACPKAMLAEQRVIVMANAGAGVTYGIRLMRELATTLLHADDCIPIRNRQDVMTRDIYFIWSVRQAGAFNWFGSELQHYKTQFDLANTVDPHFPRLHILLYHTGSDDVEDFFVETKTNSGCDTSVVNEACNEIVYNNKEISQDRTTETEPKSASKDNSIRSCVCQKRMDPKDCLSLASAPESMCLFVCGPSSFNREFKNAVASLGASRSCLLEFHCEDFEF